MQEDGYMTASKAYLDTFVCKTKTHFGKGQNVSFGITIVWML